MNTTTEWLIAAVIALIVILITTIVAAIQLNSKSLESAAELLGKRERELDNIAEYLYQNNLSARIEGAHVTGTVFDAVKLFGTQAVDLRRQIKELQEGHTVDADQWRDIERQIKEHRKLTEEQVEIGLFFRDFYTEEELEQHRGMSFPSVVKFRLREARRMWRTSGGNAQNAGGHA